MTPPRVLASTTSHKREPLLPTLDVFARLGLRDLDLNLHHVIEVGVPVDSIAKAVAANGQRIRVVSGGWCDFFHVAPKSGETDRSVARQVAVAGELGVDRLRLFFGRLTRAAYSAAVCEIITGNLRRLSDRHPAMTFVFENHDEASLDPRICREILERTDRPNIRMNFDPINFEKAGVPARDALDLVRPFIGHVHIKGLKDGHYWEFGDGDVDLTPVLKELLSTGYAGFFTVEYEGPFDGTVRLYQSVERARALLEA
jgi:sugar phosphate isomerase/epimerase